MLDRKHFKELEDIKKMYKKKDFNALIRVVESEIERYRDWGDEEANAKTINEVETYEAEAIEEAIFNLAIELANIKHNCEYWEELWDEYRDADAENLMNEYRWIIEQESKRRWDEKEAEIIKEKGACQGRVEFSITGIISKNFYRKDDIRQIEYDIEEDLKKIGLHNPAVWQIAHHIPIPFGRKKEIENISKENIVNTILSENIEYATIIPEGDGNYTIKLVKEEDYDSEKDN